MNYKSLQQNSAEYPSSLHNLHDPPEQLLIKGALPPTSTRKIAVIGSRIPTSYGRLITDRVCSKLAKCGVVTISGLALGIDGLSHKSTLDNSGTTIAVLPCSIKQVYPRSHHNLADQIVQSGGALISEYEEPVDIQKYRFPARNRIIAALADAVVIIEAGEKSGSLITANLALDLGKPVFAIPGPITNKLSKGTNQLIAGGAIPIIDVDDWLASLGLQPEPKYLHLSHHQQRILDLLSYEPYDQEMLVKKIGVNEQLLQEILTELELKDLIKIDRGQIYAA